MEEFCKYPDSFLFLLILLFVSKFGQQRTLRQFRPPISSYTCYTNGNEGPCTSMLFWLQIPYQLICSQFLRQFKESTAFYRSARHARSFSRFLAVFGKI